MANHRHKYNVREAFLKRPLDIVLSTFMLTLSLPVFLPIVGAIKLEDNGPIFYRQERWGKNGTRFKAYEFRTVVPNSDKEFGLRQARENDLRITKIGRILRAMGLDITFKGKWETQGQNFRRLKYFT